MPIPSEIRVIDQHGAEQDPRWVMANYGDLLIWQLEPALDGWRVVELQEKPGTASQVVTVIRDGEPAAGVAIGRTWGSNPAEGELADLPNVPAELATWFDRGVVGHTEANGTVGFGMGSGDHYDPANAPGHRGPSAVWLEAPGEAVVGLGMIYDNRRHLEPVLEWVAGAGPGPGPGPCDPEVVERIAVAAHLAGGAVSDAEAKLADVATLLGVAEDQIAAIRAAVAELE